MLQRIDWAIIGAFFAVSLAVGLAVTRRAGASMAEYFVSGRHMPWWLLGVSMVATTFSTDTPNLITDIVRTKGVAGNWVWWAFLLTGMLTVFVYARLWRRSGVLTDIEFYELRYSGKSAAFLRGFRALYVGVFFNVMIMAAVTLAAIKIGGVMLGLSPVQTVFLAGLVTVIYSMFGGLTGVLLTDLLQFAMAMIGSVAAAYYAVQHPSVGGLQGLLAHAQVQGKLALLPDFSNFNLAVSVFIMPLAVQWWSVWYPGSEPGGGGYIAQRMLAAKNEQHALGATFLFNVAHYALRPWPWIIVALCSLVVFPELADLQRAFPRVDAQVVKHDLGYPAMLTFLPAGLLGLVVASLVAAYMSTISTHLNWGSSYVVNDFYKRFVRPDAPERELVLVGRISTALLMIMACVFSLYLENALQMFTILLQVGAGTGLLFLLRWFWWRINAWSELAAMIISFVVALVMEFVVQDALQDWQKLVIGVGITTAGWIIVTLLTPPAEERVLRRFVELVRPGGPGWNVVRARAAAAGEPLANAGVGGSLAYGVLCMALGSVAVYGVLFATGYFLYGDMRTGAVLLGGAAVASAGLIQAWKNV